MRWLYYKDLDAGVVKN